jgi:hypothetical protein
MGAAMNWKHFLGAAIIVCAALFRFGAPLGAVVMGLCAALLIAWLRARRRAC